MDPTMSTNEIIAAIKVMIDTPSMHEELANNLRELHVKATKYEFTCTHGYWSAIDRKWVVKGMQQASAATYDAAVILAMRAYEQNTAISSRA